jgi:hypothetical protein
MKRVLNDLQESMLLEREQMQPTKWLKKNEQDGLQLRILTTR